MSSFWNNIGSLIGTGVNDYSSIVQANDAAAAAQAQAQTQQYLAQLQAQEAYLASQQKSSGILGMSTSTLFIVGGVLLVGVVALLAFKKK